MPRQKCQNLILSGFFNSYLFIFELETWWGSYTVSKTAPAHRRCTGLCSFPPPRCIIVSFSSISITVSFRYKHSVRFTGVTCIQRKYDNRGSPQHLRLGGLKVVRYSRLLHLSKLLCPQLALATTKLWENIQILSKLRCRWCSAMIACFCLMVSACREPVIGALKMLVR